MAPSEDLAALYAKNMDHFGCGTAMFEPVASSDMQPPCVGYIDHNRKWNRIANLRWSVHGAAGNADTFVPLEWKPTRQEQIDIEWRPRLSKGTRQYNFDASGATPAIGVPVGVDGHIRYKSETAFGAVLMTQKPIVLTTYNEELLFKTWLSANRALLSKNYGKVLRSHGLLLVTTTYTSPRVSINAWHNADEEAAVSVKVKASMIGDLGGDLDWTDKMSDKDWSHYAGNSKDETVVVFYDGLEVPALHWWWEVMRIRVGSRSPAPQRMRVNEPESRSIAAHRSSSVPTRLFLEDDENSPVESEPQEAPWTQKDIWDPDAPLQRPNLLSSRSVSRGRQGFAKADIPSYKRPSPIRLFDHLHHENGPAGSPERLIATPAPQKRFSTASTVTPSSSQKDKSRPESNNEPLD